MKNLKTIDLFQISITNESEESILEFITTNIEDKEGKISIMTPNPEIIMYAQKHENFKTVLSTATIALPDGVGVLVAATLLGTPLKHRIPGADFVERLCEKVSNQAESGQEKHVAVGFLGGRGSVAEVAAERLQERYPGLHVSYVAEEFDEKEFKKHEPDILFVAFGFPKQEEWIAEHLPLYKTQVMMAVGGTFDFLSGKVLRAPFFIRFLGFEWFYRLICEPWRWRRQLSLISFIWLVLKSVVVRPVEAPTKHQ